MPLPGDAVIIHWIEDETATWLFWDSQASEAIGNKGSYYRLGQLILITKGKQDWYSTREAGGTMSEIQGIPLRALTTSLFSSRS